MTIGDTVFVRWYGKIVEGMIVENNEVTPALASMVAVRIPVQGIRASALFTPDHVYSSAELAGMKEHIKVVPTESPTFVPTAEATPNDVLSEVWRKLQEFKLANWDTEHNHIRLSALNEYYDMWRKYVADKKNDYHPEADAYDGGPKPDAYKQSVSDEKMDDLKSQIKKVLAPAKPKPRKTVKYTQLAFWD